MRLFLGLLFFFLMGFFVHALFFPDLFYGELDKIRPSEISRPTNAPEEAETSDFFTYVIYNDGRFRPNRVTIKRSNYLSITNVSKNGQMFLVSDNRLLNTSRGYAESERLTALLNELGSFTVIEKNRPDALLTVTVKP